MKVFPISDPQSIQEAIRILRNGGVVVYPTETSYGLGGDWTRPSVHGRIRKIKGRERGKPLPVIVSSLSMANRYVKCDGGAKKLARAYWPGPLSLVLPLRGAYRNTPLRGSPTLSVRISSHPLAQTLVKKMGKPLIATSANVSGARTLYDARQIARACAARTYKPDLILDAGRLPRVMPSTVVRIDGDTIEVVREGPIKINSKLKMQK